MSGLGVGELGFRDIGEIFPDTPATILGDPYFRLTPYGTEKVSVPTAIDGFTLDDNSTKRPEDGLYITPPNDDTEHQTLYFISAIAEDLDPTTVAFRESMFKHIKSSKPRKCRLSQVLGGKDPDNAATLEESLLLEGETTLASAFAVELEEKYGLLVPVEGTRRLELVDVSIEKNASNQMFDAGRADSIVPAVDLLRLANALSTLEGTRPSQITTASEVVHTIGSYAARGTAEVLTSAFNNDIPMLYKAWNPFIGRKIFTTSTRFAGHETQLWQSSVGRLFTDLANSSRLLHILKTGEPPKEQGEDVMKWVAKKKKAARRTYTSNGNLRVDTAA